MPGSSPDWEQHPCTSAPVLIPLVSVADRVPGFRWNADRTASGMAWISEVRSLQSGSHPPGDWSTGVGKGMRKPKQTGVTGESLESGWGPYWREPSVLERAQRCRSKAFLLRLPRWQVLGSAAWKGILKGPLFN